MRPYRKGEGILADDIKAYGAYLAETKHSSQNTISSYLRDLHQFRDYVQDTLEADLRQVTTEEIQSYVCLLYTSKCQSAYF